MAIDKLEKIEEFIRLTQLRDLKVREIKGEEATLAQIEDDLNEITASDLGLIRGQERYVRLRGQGWKLSWNTITERPQLQAIFLEE